MMKAKLNTSLMLRSVSLLFLALFSVFSFLLWQNTEKSGLLTVAFLNIGQGDAIFIEAPSGKQVLIDGGPGRSILREMGAVLPFYDRTLDVVIATHPDADHVGGLNDVLDNFQVDLFMEPGVDADTEIYQALEERVKFKEERGEIKKILARRGMVIDLGDEAYLQILYPNGDVTSWETNEASIVARLVYGENEFLFTGDAPLRTEQALFYLQPTGNFLGRLESDVLKVGHHGSKTSTSEGFVEAVKPEYAVISVGKDNRYGHPTQVVLDVLDKFKIKTFRTDRNGRVVFKSDGMNLEVEKEIK